MDDPKSNPVKPNESLIRELKQALTLAESGAITNAVIIGVGATVYHRVFDIPKPEDFAMVTGEAHLFITEMEMIAIGNRALEQRKRGASLVMPGR